MLLKIGTGMLAVTLGATVSAGFVASRYGIATVEVQESDGTYIYLPVPIVLVSLALNFVPAEELRNAGPEIARFGPVASAVLQGLDECPDGVLVHVEDRDERVDISKQDGRLVIRVDGRSEKVNVKLPLQGTSRILNKLVERSL